MHRIRQASPADAKALSKLAESTFRATFGAMNSAEHMALHCRNSYGESIQAAEIANEQLTTFLCEQDSKLIGFAQLRRAHTPDCVQAQRPGEIQRLYVSDDWHGRGVAQTLMQTCIDELGRRGADVVWLGVWEHNQRAIAFYRKWGFVEVGNLAFPLGGDLQRDIVMMRSINSSHSPSTNSTHPLPDGSATKGSHD